LHCIAGIAWQDAIVITLQNIFFLKGTDVEGTEGKMNTFREISVGYFNRFSPLKFYRVNKPVRLKWIRKWII